MLNYRDKMKVAVIGIGTMGSAISLAFALCDKVEKVYLCKGRELSTVDGKKVLEKSVNKLIAKGRINESNADIYLNKAETGSKELTKEADLVIETVPEDLLIKKRLFEDLDKICERHTLFTTNTSSIPLSLIGENLSRPLAGMHFFNPVSAMKLVEIVSNEKCPRDMINALMCIARDIGKTPVEVKQSPGFLVNRILIPMINEAIGIYAEGVASAEDIDTAMKLGANHPMGPLELGDLIGLDVVLSIMEVMLKETGNVKYYPEALLKKMVRENKLGRKTGIGFYKY